jgi:hypothetical protein
MATEHQKHRLTAPHVIAFVMTGVVVLLQFRLLSFCLIGLLTVLLAFWPFFNRKKFLIPAALVLALTLFVPFDIALGSYHFGVRQGASPGGPHLVRFGVGKPGRTHLIHEYGEYISAGCTWPAVFPPEWILVWN